MPIVKESDTILTAPKVAKSGAQITPTEYRHSIVDSNKLPIDGLMTFISGMTWVVDYYSQVLGAEEELKDFSKEMSAAYQSYNLIRSYEMKLQGELSSNFDDAQNRLTYSGSAIIYPGLKPNKGDVIVGDIGDGRAGRFTVISVSQKTIYKNTCYSIEFELVEIMTAHIESLLQSKVIKSGRFVKDFILHGQDPVLLDEDYNKKVEIENIIEDALSKWLVEFYSYEVGTITVPFNGKCFVYDPFITMAITKLFTRDDHPLMAKINLYNCDAGMLRNYTSIWDAIISGDKHILDMAFREYQLMSVYGFNRNTFLRNIVTSRINIVVMPKLISLNPADSLSIHNVGVGHIFCEHAHTTQYDARPFKAEGIELPSLVKDSSYVVSSDTYELNHEEVPELENQLRNYFQGEYVDTNLIIKHIKLSESMSSLQRFYLIPICILLLMSSIRNI